MASPESIWEGLLRKRTRQTVTTSIPPDAAAAPGMASGGGYFQIHLAEMYLQYERALWQTYAPATLVVCDFKYGQSDVRVPFFVSTQLLAGIAAANLDKTRVRFHDTRVLGPVPYVGGQVGVFAGLFRTVIKDQRKALFSVFEKIMGTPIAAGLGPYVQLADKISDELMGMLGMSDVECIVAERNVYGTSVRTLANGYLAILDCEQQALEGRELEIVGGGLHVRTSTGSQPMDLCNYCLLRLETTLTRDDVTTLPFHAKWKEAQAMLLEGKAPEAKSALMECQMALLKSDDLTEDHKYSLIEFYQAAFFKDQQRFAQMAAPPAIAVRGGERGKHAAPPGPLVKLNELAQAVDRQPKYLGESVTRIKRLFESGVIPAAPIAVRSPATALGDDTDWEGAIRAHLNEAMPAAANRQSSDLVRVLAAAMIK